MASRGGGGSQSEATIAFLVDSSSLYGTVWLLVTTYLATALFCTKKLHPPLTVVECLFIALPTSLFVCYTASFCLISFFYEAIIAQALHLLAIGLTLYVYQNVSFFLHQLKQELRTQLRTGTSKLSLGDNKEDYNNTHPLFLGMEDVEWRLFDKSPFYLFFFGLCCFTYRFSTLFLVETENGGLESVAPLSQDLVYHVGMINSFVTGINSRGFTPFTIFEFPFLPEIPQHKSTMVEFLSAVLHSAGCSLRMCILLPGILAGSSLPPLIYLFNKRFTGNGTAALVSVLLFYFTDAPVSLEGVLGVWPKELKVSWSSLTSRYLIPLQDPLYIYPLFLVAALLLFILHTSSTSPSTSAARKLLSGASPSSTYSSSSSSSYYMSKNQRKTIFALAGICTVFNFPIQSYLALLFLAVTLFLAGIRRSIKDPLYFWHWFGYFLPALIPGIVKFIVLPYKKFFGRDWEIQGWGFLWRVEGWLDPISFWMGHLGFFVLASFFFTLSLAPRQKSFYFGFIFVFLFSNFIKTSLQMRDNLKLLYCWHFAASGVVGLGLCRLFASRIPFVRVIAVTLVLTFVMNGFYQQLTTDQVPVPIFSASQRLLAEELTVVLPYDTSVITTLSASKVIALTGRRQLLGLEADWLKQHGLTVGYRRLESNLGHFLEGDLDGLNAILSDKVKYVVLNATAYPNFGKIQSLLQDASSVVLNKGGIFAYLVDKESIKEKVKGVATKANYQPAIVTSDWSDLIPKDDAEGSEDEAVPPPDDEDASDTDDGP